MVTTVTDNSPQSINTSLFSLEKEIEASARGINKNIEDVSEVANKTAKAIEKINTEGMVVSVNNKQGIVTLDAADVGALPDTTTIPSKTSQLTNDSGFITIEDVGASYVPLTRKVNNKELDTDITLTASDVGALPDSTVVPTVVDTVASGNMNAVTSNAVAGAISEGIKRRWTETRPAASGTSPSDIIWTCIETRSGLKICFGAASAVRTSSPNGNIYYSAGSDEQWCYPVNFFTQEPVCLMEVSGNGHWMLSYTQNRGSKDYTKKICPASGTTFTNLVVRYDIVAFGI